MVQLLVFWKVLLAEKYIINKKHTCCAQAQMGAFAWGWDDFTRIAIAKVGLFEDNLFWCLEFRTAWFFLHEIAGIFFPGFSRFTRVVFCYTRFLVDAYQIMRKDAHQKNSIFHQIILPTGSCYFIILMKIITLYFCFALKIFLPDSTTYACWFSVSMCVPS